MPLSMPHKFLNRSFTRLRPHTPTHTPAHMRSLTPAPSLTLALTFILSFFLSVLFSQISRAEDTGLQARDLRVFTQSVTLGAQLDAYETFCEEPPMRPLAQRILATAAQKKASEPQILTLTDLANETYHATLQTLGTESPDCKDVDFMFEKYSLYQKLNTYVTQISGESGHPL